VSLSGACYFLSNPLCGIKEDNYSRFIMNYGIDLGTTNSCVAGWNEKLDCPRFFLNDVEGSTVTPSVVFFDPDDINKALVGNKALASYLGKPNRVVRGIKRRIGDKNSYNPNINGLPNGSDPVAISSLILKKLIQDVKRGHQQSIENVVIAVPAYFGFEQRAKTKLAGQYAGLNVLELIPEPTAAALAYGLDSTEDKNVIIYDLGGGTFDVTFIRIIAQEDDINTFKGVALDGDSHLGGMDWDRELAQLFLDEYNSCAGTTYSLRKEEELTDDSVEARLTATLLLEAEKYKKFLAPDVDKVDWSISFDGRVISGKVTLAEFNQCTKHLLDRTIEMTRRVIETALEAGYGKPDEIVLVGGSSRMSQVQVAIREAFGIEPKLHDPDFAVATGASIYANKIGKYSSDFDDVIHVASTSSISTSTAVNNILSKTYGVEMADNSVGNVIFRNERLPIDKIVNRFRTSGEDEDSLALIIYESDLLESRENLLVPASEVDAKCERVAECEIKFIKKYPSYTPFSMHIKLNNEQLIDIEIEIEGEKQSAQVKLAIQENPAQGEYIGAVKVS
ncbi:MAG: Hsp70 family protein, partial [Candidatus Cryptobacteroides sp.]